jgi:hypothetical protein
MKLRNISVEFQHILTLGSVVCSSETSSLYSLASEGGVGLRGGLPGGAEATGEPRETG